MEESILLLTFSAATIGFVHTLFGPDHYIPFIAIAKDRKWTLHKTLFITLLCGVAHILSSVVISFVGIFLGIALNQLELINSIRGEVAAWLLISFGLIYFIWGIRKCKSSNNQLHDNHLDFYNKDKNITTWVLFIIFIFGPCESLIPLLLYPTVQKNIYAILLITTIFMITTIGTMLFIVTALFKGVKLLKLDSLEKYSQAIAGIVILICGLAIEFLGL